MCVVCFRYILNQIVEQLNRKETEHFYKTPIDHDRKFTIDNVQAFLKRVFPSRDDTQAAVAMLQGRGPKIYSDVISGRHPGR